MELTLFNEIAEIPKIFRQVDTLLSKSGVPKEEMDVLKVVLDEALSNIIYYAYPEDSLQKIIMEISISDGVIVISIKDGGIPFNPLNYKNLPNPRDSQKEGGLGIYLMKKMVDSIEYLRSNGYNLLHIVKKYTPLPT